MPAANSGTSIFLQTYQRCTIIHYRYPRQVHAFSRSLIQRAYMRMVTAARSRRLNVLNSVDGLRASISGIGYLRSSLGFKRRKHTMNVRRRWLLLRFQVAACKRRKRSSIAFSRLYALDIVSVHQRNRRDVTLLCRSDFSKVCEALEHNLNI